MVSITFAVPFLLTFLYSKYLPPFILEFVLLLLPPCINYPVSEAHPVNTYSRRSVKSIIIRIIRIHKI